MSDSRYFDYNTQIINPVVDPLVSREFINETNASVIKKIPVDDRTVFVFAKNTDSRLGYVKYLLQDDENYVGNFILISEPFVITNDNIFAFNSYYEPSESFYFLYNKDNNIYLRSFYLKQGYINFEILVKENARVERVDRIKESFFMVIKTLENKEIFDMVGLSDGELKMLLLFENDITRFEGKYDSVLKTQLLDIPFSDIGEVKHTCDNQVGNEQGFLYFTSSPTLQSDATSINGYSFTNPGDVYMKMNEDSADYTLVVRGVCSSLNSLSGATKEILETNNIKIKTYNNNILVMFSNGVEYMFAMGNSVMGDIYSNIFVISERLSQGRRCKLYINNASNDEIMFEASVDVETNDKYLILKNYSRLDYISLKNTALSFDAAKDVNKAFERKLVTDTLQTTYYFYGNEIDHYLSNKQAEFNNNYIIPLPSSAIPISGTYTCTTSDYKKTFWLNTGAVLKGSKAKNLTVFMEKNSTFVNGDSTTGKVYAKSGCVVNLNNATKFSVLYEDGATLLNYNSSSLFRRDDNLIFDYDNIPISAAYFSEIEVKNYVNQLIFPVLPGEFNVSEVNISCLASVSPSNRYVTNSDGTYTDNLKGLMWLQTPVVIPQNKPNKQNQAFNIAKDFTHLQYSDWRLPTLEDFLTLVSSVNIPLSSYGFFDLSGIISAGPYECWTSTSDNPNEQSSSEGMFKYNIKTHTYIRTDPTTTTAPLMFLVRHTDAYLKLTYNDGTKYQIPTLKGQSLDVTKTGIISITRNSPGRVFQNGVWKVSAKQILTPKEDLLYPDNFVLSSSNKFSKGMFLSLDRTSFKSELSETVLPIFIDDSTGIPSAIYANPEENIRVYEHLSQRYSPTPFIIDYNNTLSGVTLWTALTSFDKKIGLQYSLKEESFFNPTAATYSAFSSQTYPLDEYFCAYHFDKLVNASNLLVKEVDINVSGEILLKGVTDKNTYLREIKAINFFKSPAKYKTSDFNLSIDAKNSTDRQSFINNYDEIRKFVAKIVEKWKPATANLNEIIEDKTLIMSQLLKNEYTQVLVGLTSRQNTNAYYVRSADTGNMSIYTSSQNYNDEIEWIGVGRINTPYIKTGVTKIKKSAKNIKIPFETRYANTSYRTFVFAPIDSKYYVVAKDADGFIVESSSLVEEEVAWITLNTAQVINGTINWKTGIPDSATIFSQLDRSEEINNNASKYDVTFAGLGYPEFNTTEYSVILSTDKNINVWIENKTATGFTIRRSYAGEDVSIDLLVVLQNSQWWKNVTG
jgi:hypothetical protein